MLLNTPSLTKSVLRSPLLWPLTLAVLTLVLGAWQHVGMNRVYKVFPNPKTEFYGVSDQSSGGDSEAAAYVQDGSLWLECTIRDQYQWPYCQVDFSFANTYLDGLRGDLYDRIHLNIEHRAPKPNETLRVFVRGYSPEFTQAGQYNTLMPNQIEYQPNRYPEGINLELERFVAATWWLSEMELPLHLQKPTFNRIPLIQISTGSYVTPGAHKIAVKEVRLQGKWIQAEPLYSALLALWVLTTLNWSLRYALRLRKDLALEREKIQGLEQLTNYLELTNLQLESEAQRDELTKLRNRAGLRDHLYELVQQSQRDGQPLCLMFLDIDHFKSINDTFGHGMGDAVLKEFGQLLCTTVRKQDILARWGGEEFLLLCPNTKLEEAQLLAEKLRQCIESSSWPHHSTITCSFGLAECNSSDPRALIETADQALYQAKRQGRNAVVTEAMLNATALLEN